MNNMTGTLLALLGIAGAAYTDVPNKMTALFDDTLAAARQVSTAGDIHTMSVMLDAKYVMDRRLPTENGFPAWLKENFKENDVKDLALDHWGNLYIYKVLKKNRQYRLVSMGPDGVAGTDDDLIRTGP